MLITFLSVMLLLAAMAARSAAQSAGDVTYHNGAAINKYSVSLTSDGIITSEPVASNTGDQAMVWVAVSATKV
jgi:hypothetical protein